MPTLTEQKHLLRQQLQPKLQSIPEGQKKAWDLRIIQKLKESVLIRPTLILGAFVPTATEVNIWSFLESLPPTIQLSLPRVLSESAEMEFCRVTSLNELVKGQFGLLEPAPSAVAVSPTTIQVMLIPGLAFDREGYRLGKGGGHFDRFLQRVSPMTQKIGVAYQIQCVEELPHESHDIKMTQVITER